MPREFWKILDEALREPGAPTARSLCEKVLVADKKKPGGLKPIDESGISHLRDGSSDASYSVAKQLADAIGGASGRALLDAWGSKNLPDVFWEEIVRLRAERTGTAEPTPAHQALEILLATLDKSEEVQLTGLLGLIAGAGVPWTAMRNYLSGAVHGAIEARKAEIKLSRRGGEK